MRGRGAGERNQNAATVNIRTIGIETRIHFVETFVPGAAATTPSVFAELVSRRSRLRSARISAAL